MLKHLIVVGIAGLAIAGLAYILIPRDAADPRPIPETEPPPTGAELATFGGGCFWCTEAVFQKLKGVYTVVPGYAGGSVKNPTYRQVGRSNTGHAEVIQITFDPKTITFADLLEVFWQTHDPTTRNRQGGDVGSQYRSVVLYHTPEQKETAERYRQKLDASGAFDAPLVTEIMPFTELYVAETYHHNYYMNNPHEAYCVRIIGPKMEKFEKVFKAKLRGPARHQ
jgi:peptide-methionine (S)-S-oxide reductase